MNRSTLLGVLTAGIAIGFCVCSIKNRHAMEKARMTNTKSRRKSDTGSHLVKITGGPSWSIGEYATFDSEQNLLIIEGEEFPAAEFEFSLT